MLNVNKSLNGKFIYLARNQTYHQVQKPVVSSSRSGKLSKPGISDYVSQIWHMFWYIENTTWDSVLQIRGRYTGFEKHHFSMVT